MHPGYLRLTLTKHTEGADPPAAYTPPHDAKHAPHDRLDSPGTFIEKQISTTWQKLAFVERGRLMQGQLCTQHAQKTWPMARGFPHDV